MNLVTVLILPLPVVIHSNLYFFQIYIVVIYWISKTSGNNNIPIYIKQINNPLMYIYCTILNMWLSCPQKVYNTF